MWVGTDGVMKALGKSSLKPEDAVPDYSTLEPSEKATLDQWYGFFAKVSTILLTADVVGLILVG
jgi:membrane-associated progesterone receptor component